MLKSFTDRLSNKPFLMWLLTTPPHLKYVATLPCNLTLMACLADINVSQGSVATHAKCGGIVNIHLTANLPGNLPVKNRFRFDRIVVMSLWPHFFGTPCKPVRAQSVLNTRCGRLHWSSFSAVRFRSRTVDRPL